MAQTQTAIGGGTIAIYMIIFETCIRGLVMLLLNGIRLQAGICKAEKSTDRTGQTC